MTVKELKFEITKVLSSIGEKFIFPYKLNRRVVLIWLLRNGKVKTLV